MVRVDPIMCQIAEDLMISMIRLTLWSKVGCVKTAHMDSLTNSVQHESVHMLI